MESSAAEEQAAALLERWRCVAPSWHEGAPTESWAHSAKIERSSLALLHEHLRRLGLLSLQWEALQHWNFCDDALIPVVVASDPDAELSHTWRAKLAATDLEWAARTSAANHLLWTLFVAQMRDPPVGVPDPYEPWLRLFERGAYLFQHDERFYVSDACATVPRPYPEYASAVPLGDLTDDALDSIDGG